MGRKSAVFGIPDSGYLVTHLQHTKTSKFHGKDEFGRMGRCRGCTFGGSQTLA